jgi:hypothetical protein
MMHLGHHIGPDIDAPSYEDADLLVVLNRLAERGVRYMQEDVGD